MCMKLEKLNKHKQLVSDRANLFTFLCLAQKQCLFITFILIYYT